MKLHWGWWIAIIYGVFVLIFLGVLLVSLRQDNSLVTEDYYATDLAYQDHKDKVANTRALPASLDQHYDAVNKTYHLSFPEQMSAIQGEVLFYRPSSAHMDFRVAIRPDTLNQQVIPVSRLVPGQWMVKIEWQDGSTPYYTETRLVVPAS